MRVLAIAMSILAGALLAGCGEDDSSTSTAAADEADQSDVEVIEGWSATLSEGDVEGAAEYFAIPSIAQNGTLLVRIESREDAIEFNESLPCGAEVISARSQGEFTTATFRLSERPGGGCGPGVGGTASTSFVIEDGEIVEWRRVDGQSPGGEGGGGGAPV